MVTMLVANLAAIPMQDGAIPLLSGLVPILTVLGAELVLSWLILKSLALRRLLTGKPVILINNGKVLRENLRSTRVTMDELEGQLRQQQILDIRTVQYAILETDGHLSVFPYPQNRPAEAAEAGVKTQKQFLPVTVVSDGRLIREDLKTAGKDRRWLEKTLKKQGARLEDTLLLSVDDDNNVIWLGMEGKS